LSWIIPGVLSSKQQQEQPSSAARRSKQQPGKTNHHHPVTVTRRSRPSITKTNIIPPAGLLVLFFDRAMISSEWSKLSRVQKNGRQQQQQQTSTMTTTTTINDDHKLVYVTLSSDRTASDGFLASGLLRHSIAIDDDSVLLTISYGPCLFHGGLVLGQWINGTNDS
jgi:hypothetical protein